MQAESSTRPPRTGLILGLVLVVVALTYSGALSGGFVFDDHVLAQPGPACEAPSLARTFGQMMGDGRAANRRPFYRPLVSLSFDLDRCVGGGAPWSFHLANILFHLLACLLVFVVARRGGASPVGAGLAAAVFGVLPRTTESVAWISGRTDALATVAVLAVIAVDTAPWPTRLRQAAVAGLLLLGLLSKEVAAAGFVAVLVLAVARANRGARIRAAAAEWPVLLVIPIYGGLRLLAAAPAHPGARAIGGPLGWERLLRPLDALGAYASMLLDPFRSMLQVEPAGAVNVWRVVLGVVVVAGIVLLTVRSLSRRTSPVVLATAAAGLAALVPVVHLVPGVVDVLAADRFVYLTEAALAVVVAIEASRMHSTGSRLIGAGVTGLAIVALALTTRQRVLDWRNDLRLWHATLAQDAGPQPMAWIALGDALSDRVRPGDACAAYVHAQTALDRLSVPERVKDGILMLLDSDIASCRQDLGHYDEAIRRYRRLVDGSPNRTTYRLDLAMAYARALDFDHADGVLEGTATASPKVVEHLRKLFAESRTALSSRDANTPPSTDELARLATANDRLGRLADARRFWQEVATRNDASGAQLLRAAGFLAFKGTRQQATWALSRLQLQGGHDPQLEALLDVVQSRWAD